MMTGTATSRAPVRAILTISSDAAGACPLCRDYTLDGVDHFDAAVNHVLAHGWILLHLGSQDLTEADGATYRTTIAVLGDSSDAASSTTSAAVSH